MNVKSILFILLGLVLVGLSIVTPLVFDEVLNAVITVLIGGIVIGVFFLGILFILIGNEMRSLEDFQKSIDEELKKLDLDEDLSGEDGEIEIEEPKKPTRSKPRRTKTASKRTTKKTSRSKSKKKK